MIKSLIVGVVVGGVFAAFKLPVPAPSTVEGICGVVGLFIGYLIYKSFI